MIRHAPAMARMILITQPPPMPIKPPSQPPRAAPRIPKIKLRRKPPSLFMSLPASQPTRAPSRIATNNCQSHCMMNYHLSKRCVYCGTIAVFCKPEIIAGSFSVIAGSFPVSVKSFIKMGGCAGLSLPATRLSRWHFLKYFKAFFLRRCLSNRPWSTLAHKSVNLGFVCQAGAVSRRKMGAKHRLNLSF